MDTNYAGASWREELKKMKRVEKIQDGKSISQTSAKMEAETKSPALKGDLIHQKYHELMKTLIHNNIYFHLVHRRCGEFDCQSELTLRRKFEHMGEHSLSDPLPAVKLYTFL